MNILLNCFPPSTPGTPSPALSILKSFLVSNGYHVDVKYWNILLADIQQQFLNNKPNFDVDIDGLLLFINYILVHSNEQPDFSDLKYHLLSVYPKWNNLRKDYVSSKMRQYASDLEKIIMREINSMNLDKYALFGISTKFHQWICGGIVANKIKEAFPGLKIVIGGMGTSDEAMALMKNFDYYDYAIWGEGEYPLFQLCQSIENTSSAINIPYLIYRDEANVPQISSPSKKKIFFDMNSKIIPDYSDYFEQNNMQISKIALPIEGSRGCHWNKCNFCYLNDGYKHRAKTTSLILDEVELLINKYNVRSFFQVDNDIIGKDLKEFGKYLDGLISIKSRYNDFEILSAEVITKGINSSIIKKMAIAGFKNIQIGYESSSNKLLMKINKKNTFASNLLFIKWARLFSLPLSGANIIMGLLEETAEDVMEAIDNLDYLRFALHKNIFQHNYALLHISTSSPYFQTIEKQNDLDKWDKTPPIGLLPYNYVDTKSSYILFYYYQKNQKCLWDYFKIVEGFYLSSNFHYKIFQNANDVHYCEYYKGLLINELIFENDSLHWKILNLCNHQVLSLEQLKAGMLQEKQDDIILAIESLRNEKLLYTNYDLSEIVSVINSDTIL
jgi:radical SAM superfamily enzyme YgiQ (UPF0313 family)